MPSILLVDDDGGILDLLTGFFEKRAWSVHRAATGGGAARSYERERPDLVLLDLHLPDTDGLDVLRRLREFDEDATVIMLTGHGDIETAVASMRMGAENFLTKPLELGHLAAVVDRAEEKAELRRHNRLLAGGDVCVSPDALGVSPTMREITTRMERIATGDGTVLLQGETGSGKGWVARRIHERSSRRGKPFVSISCGSLSPTVLDAELFGHESGAGAGPHVRKDGLFEVADGGTIFLDDIGDLAPELQPKLLKVLEDRRFLRIGGARERAVDVRVIAASNRDLAAAVADGAFREDLYYRLAVLPLELPPLRERSAEDIAGLTYALLEELASRTHAHPIRVEDRTLDALVRYRWPGNIRELRNLLERILILAGDIDEIRLSHLPPELRGAPTSDLVGKDHLTLEEVERQHIARVLEVNDGNRSRTARVLGISRAALYDKMDRFGLRAVGL